MRSRLRLVFSFWISLFLFADAATASADSAPPSQIPPMIGPTLTLPGIAPGTPMKFVAYGDTRFTDPSNVTDTNPKVRQFLVRQIAAEKPLAIFITGDTPFTGSDPADWKVFQQETKAWRDEKLHVFPTTGNHEIKGGYNAGVANYLANFPQLKGYRYYSAQIGNVYLISLDGVQTTAIKSPQYAWLKSQLENIPADIDFVFLLHHMPWMADVQTQIAAKLPSKGELNLRDLLESEVAKSRAKFIVLNGHIHNYERFERQGITYLISGGGAAKAYPILVRGNEDQYGANSKLPPPMINYHYLVIQVEGKHAKGTMYRVADPKAEKLSIEKRDEFVLDKK